MDEIKTFSRSIMRPFRKKNSFLKMQSGSRQCYLQSNMPCIELSEDLEGKMELIRQRKQGLYVLATNVPAEHLEPAPNAPDVFQVVDGTSTAVFIHNIARETGCKPSTAQRTLPDSRDDQGRRTKLNHDVLVMINL